MAAIDRFRASMDEAKDLLGLYRNFRPMVTKSLDATDILRASLVFAVGALDSYVHTKVEDGLLGQSLANPAVLTNKATKIGVSLGTFVAAAHGGFSTMEAQIRGAIVDAIGWQTFQKSDRLAEALKWLKDDSFWNYAAANLRRPQKDLMDELDLIVVRRNKIAHEGDRPVTGGVLGLRTPISDTDVEKAHLLIEALVTCIESFV